MEVPDLQRLSLSLLFVRSTRNTSGHLIGCLEKTVSRIRLGTERCGKHSVTNTIQQAEACRTKSWRRQTRPRKLTVEETLEEEAFSSTKSCMQGCTIYLDHILDPLCSGPQKPEVIEAINGILEIAKEIPEGYGLEMGIYWGLFIAGVAIFNDPVSEDLIRWKLKADTTYCIYVRILSRRFYW
jgi:hypothetical protein